eukprot:TRINITY_DN1253_c0_g1_i5.p1 TRINITY_DN1253_c0_g1~~TRINITY_DN1253_c0_g1_i5.p1  ORF type:complete len:358 (+),score=70.39 TRINITY_DN1253_c0_g1_i5:1544-2617(+)
MKHAKEWVWINLDEIESAFIISGGGVNDQDDPFRLVTRFVVVTNARSYTFLTVSDIHCALWVSLIQSTCGAFQCTHENTRSQMLGRKNFAKIKNCPVSGSVENSCINVVIDAAVPQKGSRKASFQRLSAKKQLKQLRKAVWFRCVTCDIVDQFLCFNCAQACHFDHKLISVPSGQLPGDVEAFMCYCESPGDVSCWRHRCLLEYKDKTIPVAQRKAEMHLSKLNFSEQQVSAFVQNSQVSDCQSLKSVMDSYASLCPPSMKLDDDKDDVEVNTQIMDSNCTEIIPLEEKFKEVSNVSQVLQERNLCRICFENPISAIFIPCAHVVSCFECCSSDTGHPLDSCPFCSTKIQLVHRVYE